VSGPKRLTATLAAAAAVSAGAAAVGAGVAVRRLTAPPPLPPTAAELLNDLPGESWSVTADDGLPLSVVETGRGRLTVVFVHGYCVDRRCWHYQWRALAHWREGGARLVAYDQRSHGRSGRSRPGRSTIDQLGSDLYEVLAARAALGPVVLVGHSMGGMTIMALAHAHPELFGEGAGRRIVGVALLGTSAGKLGELSYGLPAGISAVAQHIAPWAVARLSRGAALVDAGRRASGSVGGWLTKRYSFASDVPPERFALMADMIEGTPFQVIAEFFPAFASHDKLAALGVLNPVQTLVLAGDKDLQTPADHSRDIAAQLPKAELVVVPRAGHMIMLEHPEVVDARLGALLDRASPP